MFEKWKKGLRIVVNGNVPSKSNSYGIRKGGKGLYKKKHLKDYERGFYLQVNRCPKIIKSSFKIYLKVFYGSNRPDLDNSLKIILDCLQKKGIIRNDRDCEMIIAIKGLDRKNPRIEMYLSPV